MSIDIVIFSIIPVIIKIEFIDFLFVSLYFWTIWSVDIYIAVIIHSKWRNTALPRIFTVFGDNNVVTAYFSTVQISAQLKEALKVDYLLGFPLLPPEPLRLRGQVPERGHGAGAGIRVITARAR